MKEVKRNVPKLRFPGFTGDWEQRKLNEITSVAPFKPYLKEAEEEGDYVVIQQGDNPVLGYAYGEPFADFEKVTLFGDHTLSLYKPISPFFVATDGLKILYSEEMEGKLYYYLLERYKPVSEGYKRHFSILKECECSFPKDRREQRKLGDFFSNLDKTITLHQRKIDRIKEYKKGMLQKMFPKKGASIPEVRFPGFTGDWEQRRLGEIAERVIRKNKGNESDLPLTISSQDGLIDQRAFFNKVVAAKDMSNYYLLQKGEYAYNKSYSKGFDYGSIKRLNAYDQGCLSTLYICFAITSEEVDSDYLEHYFDTLLWYTDVSQICAEGARNHGLLNVDTKAFFENLTIRFPSSKQEQAQLSAFLSNIDNLITLHQSKLDKLKELKKGLLQQMFV